MYSFANDYSEGAHPKVLELMERSNFQQNLGYGKDIHCERARDYIRKAIDDKGAEVHFIPGGTMANLIVISAFLRPHEAVISADTGHIFTHETGAIEATGHKIITVAGKDGKLTPEAIRWGLRRNAFEHTPKPRMVYISNSTELGTVYTKEELTAISQLCQEENLIFFLDGARLGSALMSKKSDLSLKDIAQLTDVFYIGGTKNGAYLGEALVITREDLKEDFRYLIKQRGALLAKGFLMGMQFEALFEDDLYFQLAKDANDKAERIVDILKAHRVEFFVEPASNQLFPILPNDFLEKFSKEFLYVKFDDMEDDKSLIRLVTSWATTDESIDALGEFFHKHYNYK